MAKKNVLPKRIAGVKVPKQVRKGRFGELLASPAGQQLLAEAIVAIGAVAAAKKVKDNPETRGAIGEAAGQGATEATDAFAYAFGEAARSFTDALRRHGEDGLDAGRQDGPDGHWPELPSARADPAAEV